MEIDKNDAILLDLIVDKIIETKEPIWLHDFNDTDFINIDDIKLKELEFTRLINILRYKGIGKTMSYQFYPDSIQRNENTIKFKERGGFKKLFQDELEKIEKETEIELIKNKKLRWDAKISKWQVKTFWPVFVFGLLGFIFGLYNFITQIVDSRKTKELQIELRNTKKEVSKLRTLILDQKTVDSLHNSKTDIDSLRPK